jgi:hypothetical protein
MALFRKYKITKIREKTVTFIGGLARCPPQVLCPWTPLGAYGGPQIPAYFFLVHVIPFHQKFLDLRLSTSTNKNK